MPRRRITGHEKKVVAARQGWRCDSCNEVLEATFEVDHEIPLHLGGEDLIDNCHALCSGCHAAKTQREEIDRLRREERLRNARGRPPLVCTRCDQIVSPYFCHTCHR